MHIDPDALLIHYTKGLFLSVCHLWYHIAEKFEEWPHNWAKILIFQV